MRQIYRLLFLFSIAACGDSTQTTNTTTVDTAAKVTDATKQETTSAASSPFGFDTTYEVSKEHRPYMVTGYFNTDDILDTAILVRYKSTDKDALFIKHGGSETSFLLKNGKDVGTDFDDFNWVGEFSVTKKGTKVWNNVIDGEIVGGDQVPEKSKFTLKTDGIWVHVDEASGGGIIYYKSGKYVWVQQD